MYGIHAGSHSCWRFLKLDDSECPERTALLWAEISDANALPSFRQKLLRHFGREQLIIEE